MTGPLDPLSWDDMLDDLGYSSEEDDTYYYKDSKSKKSNKGSKKTKFRDYEWDEYD